ncbi:helix-turn-helix domain-containing protein [Planosporangium flavigriseum]|uniref:IclR family transcriptional regulator n=1 Tax=Planosporangium flavigriseum TaxID=373681 RepID=A0A8J3LR20_9ACTN|nr:IclR family transcriptional regulator C-terminal domain-containing protein [Planosporangium flavigriseum]NJC67742.1 helix-turn-helix domain-containing protein [Planosporangium flavigriseum]GIG76019.1 IclR family transcriptional regulator [Planosporangium flavigriseum]
MSDPTRRSPRNTDFVQSLARGLAVINAFDAANPRMTLSQVARAANMPPAAARRFLLTLLQLGYVAYEDGLYSLRPRVLSLGYGALSRLTLRDVAEPHLESLAAEVHESTSLTVLDGADIVYAARVATSRIMTHALGLGSRLPTHVTAMGRVLLANLPPDALEQHLDRVRFTRRTSRTICDADELRAELDRIRKQGWCIVDEELEEGVRAVAVPVRSRHGVTVAALNVATHASRHSVDDLRRSILPPLLATAARIEADLLIYPATPAPDQRGSARV